MKFPRITRRRILAGVIALPTLPALLWAVVLFVAPTEWARARVTAELEAATGRKVTIGSIRLGLLGNLRARSITVGEVETPGDPWLKADEARLDVHLFQMVAGCCSPTEIAVDGLDLRIHRRADGSLEFAGLLGLDPAPAAAVPPTATPDPGTAPSPAPATEPASNPEPAASPSPEPETGAGSKRKPRSIHLAIRGGRVTLIDDPSGTKLLLDRAQGKATWSAGLATVESLRGELNGGAFEFVGTYDGSTDTSAFEAEAQARGVALGVGMKSLGLLLPVVTDVAESVDGKVDLNLALSGRGNSFDRIKPTLKGHGAIRVEPIDLSGSKLLDKIDGLRQIPRASRVGSVGSHFGIENARVSSDDLTIEVARIPIVLAGWTDFNGALDYGVKTDPAMKERLLGKLPGEARAILADLKTDLGDLTTLRITGTVDAPKLSTAALNPPGEGQGSRRDLDKARFREAARKLGDRYIR